MIINGRKVERIVAAGCSFCYGDELVDPFNQSWPKKLADKLGIDCTNLGVCAAGNENIQNSILDYFSEIPEHVENSIVIIGFTSVTRIEFPNRKISRKGDRYWPNCWTTMIRKGFPDMEFIESFFLKYYNETYYYARYLRIIILLQNYFENKKIPYIMFNALTPSKEKKDHTIIDKLYDLIDKRYFLEFENNWSDLLQEYDKSKYLPGGHPSPEQHINMADLLYRRINEYYKVNS